MQLLWLTLTNVLKLENYYHFKEILCVDCDDCQVYKM